MTNYANAEGADTTTATTREGWLMAAVDAMRPEFEAVGMTLPEQIHVSIGFGYGVRAESKYILGQTWSKVASKDGVNHVFLGPMEGDSVGLLITLRHELIHVADDNKSGHRGAFAEAATRLGFLGPMTQTPPSIELTAEMMTLAASLGEYPGEGAALDVDVIKAPVPVPVPGADGIIVRPPKIASGPAKQGTRYIKVQAPCGYTARVTRVWLAEGLPKCPHGDDMTPTA